MARTKKDAAQAAKVQDAQAQAAQEVTAQEAQEAQAQEAGKAAAQAVKDTTAAEAAQAQEGKEAGKAADAWKDALNRDAQGKAGKNTEAKKEGRKPRKGGRKKAEVVPHTRKIAPYLIDGSPNMVSDINAVIDYVITKFTADQKEAALALPCRAYSESSAVEDTDAMKATDEHIRQYLPGVTITVNDKTGTTKTFQKIDAEQFLVNRDDYKKAAAAMEAADIKLKCGRKCSDFWASCLPLDIDFITLYAFPDCRGLSFDAAVLQKVETTDDGKTVTTDIDVDYFKDVLQAIYNGGSNQQLKDDVKALLNNYFGKDPGRYFLPVGVKKSAIDCEKCSHLAAMYGGKAKFNKKTGLYEFYFSVSQKSLKRGLTMIAAVIMDADGFQVKEAYRKPEADAAGKPDDGKQEAGKPEADAAGKAGSRKDGKAGKAGSRKPEAAAA